MAAKLWSAVAVVALVGVAAFAYNQTQNMTGHVRMREAKHAAHDSVDHDSPDGGAADAMDSAPINACALLKDEEVSEVVGALVTPGQRRDDGEVGNKGDYAPPGTYSSTCFWQFHADGAQDDPNLPMGGRRFAILNAMVWPQGGNYAAEFLKSFYDAAEKEIIPAKPVPVEGIGDEALWWGDGTAVRKGDRSYGISVFLQNGDKATQRKMEELLARKIAGRI
jgi:hypothetical protein